MTSVLVQSILHEDKLVRVAAASVAFNVAAWVQRGRVARIQGGNEPKNGGMREDEEDGEWEVELVSAIVEALEREKESEEVGKSLRVCDHHSPSLMSVFFSRQCSSPFVGDAGATHPTVSGL